MKLKRAGLIPLAAAAAAPAAALALSLVALRHAEAQTGRPAVAGIPRYFAIANEGPVSHDQMAAIDVTVGDVRTGKAIAASPCLPSASRGDNAAVGVSAAGDDRTFVVGRRDVSGDTHFFLVHVAPGAKRVATVKHLPIPSGLGAMLGSRYPPTARNWRSCPSGATARPCGSTPSGPGQSCGPGPRGPGKYQGIQDLAPNVSWTADSRQVGSPRC